MNTLVFIRQVAVVLGIQEHEAACLEVQDFIRPDGRVNAARVEYEIGQLERQRDSLGPI